MKNQEIKTSILLLAILICGCNPINYGNNNKVGKYYNVNGIRLYTEEYGTGKPLVLIHGNGGSMASMSGLVPKFSKDYRVILVDSRAHGKSVDVGDSLSFEMMADDMAALLDEMKIDSAYFIGWSDGGIIAIETAMRHPNKVIKFAATGANLWPDSTALIPSLWNEEKIYYDSLKYKTKNEKEQNSWKIFLLDWEQPNINLTDLKKITSPALVISGDHDLIRLEHTFAIFQNIPGAQLWVVANSGHGTFIDHPDEFYRTVNQFFVDKK